MTEKHPRAITTCILSHYTINTDMRENHEHIEELPECRYRSLIGRIGFSIERLLLTELLERYYNGTSLPSMDAPPLCQLQRPPYLSNLCA